MRPLGWIVGGITLVLLGTPYTALAQPVNPSGECRDGELDQEEILRLIETDVAAEAPLTSPSANQIGAPSSTAANMSLVDQPGFTNLLGFAIENDLVSSDSNSLTINLNLFAFKAAIQPEVIDRQSLYGNKENTILRRFGGAVTLGGQGVSFDRDGDGQVDEALQADQLQDNVVWEVRYRFAGTRDRRDNRNFNKLLGSVRALSDQLAEMEQEILAELGRFINLTGSCIEAKQVKTFLNQPGVRPRLQEIVSRSRELRDAILEVNEKIDSRTVWSLVTGGISREEQLGPDERRIGIRGAFGSESSDRSLTLNLDWTETEGLLGAPDSTKLRAALQLSTLWLKGSLISPEGVTVSLSGAYETFQDIPEGAHDTNAKFNLKLDFPLTRGISVPFSLTWANHKDLIEGEAEIRGHIGFTLDLGQLLDIGLDDNGSS